VLSWAREHRESFRTIPLTRLAHEARNSLGPEAGPCALTLVRLWWKHREKFPTWPEFLGDTEAFQQASGERPARWRAARFSELGTVLDLCCGAGADSIALSSAAGRLVAVDRNYPRLTWARANVERYGDAGRVRYLCADALSHLPDAHAAFLDPDRRAQGHRAVSPQQYSPPPTVWERIRSRVPNMAVKVAPGLSYDEIPTDAVPEFVEDRGECREAVLWYGDLRPAGRTATVLSASGTGGLVRGDSITALEPASDAVGEIGNVMYDPGPATVRAHLVTQLAARLGAWRIDEQIAYLSGERSVSSPFARAFRVEAVWPFHLKRLKAALRERRIGALEIRTRRFPLRPEDLRRQLGLAGERTGTLILTKIHGNPVAILCEPVNR
jgi:SAM-dependent methyltransferase